MAFSRDPYHSKSKVEKKREIREDEKMTRERDSHGENERGNGRNETVSESFNPSSNSIINVCLIS